MSRTSYVVGPAFAEAGAAGQRKYIHTEGDIIVNEVLKTDTINSAMFGPVSKLVLDRAFEVALTPVGEVKDVATYLPYLSKKIGDDLFPQTDEPLILWGADQTKRSYSSGALTDLPQIRLSATKTIWGAMKYLVLGQGDAAWSVANSMVTHATGQTLPGNTLDRTKVKRNLYSATWAGKTAPWIGFKTKDGFVIDLKLNTGDKEVDQFGLVNKYITGLDVSVTFCPLGMSESDIQAAMGFQGAGAARGMDLAGLGGDLVITGGVSPTLVTATVKNAAIESVEYDYSTSNPRVKSVKMIATNNAFIGTLSDYFNLTIA